MHHLNKLLNRKVSLSFSLPGLSYPSSNFQKEQHVNLFFVNVIFLKDWLHYVTYSGILMMRDNMATCNTMAAIQPENEISKERQLWGQGKQLFWFFYSNMCDIPYLLDKCTLDKMPERSKIIENISTLFSLTLVSIKFRKK